MFSLDLTGYRSFKDTTTLHVAPMTVLYGHNQSGKSSLLRLLRLLSQSHRRPNGPLDLSCSAARGASFRELCWRGEDPVFQFTVALSVQGSGRLKWTFGEDPAVAIRHLRFDADGTVQSHLDLRLDEATSVSRGRYLVELDDKTWVADLPVLGLLPDMSSLAMPQDIEERVHRIASSIEHVVWLEARRAPKTFLDRRPTLVHSLASDGSDVGHLLNHRPELQEAVSEWLMEAGFGEGVELVTREAGDLELRTRRGNHESLLFRAASDGMAEVVPVVALCLWAISGEKGAPRVICIEEPESNLHPNRVQPLLDLLVRVAKSGVAVVVETHSLELLRSMQVAVLEERLGPSDVSLNWSLRLSSGANALRRCSLDSSANIEGWPPHAFAEDHALAVKVLDLRLAREDLAETSQ